MKQMWEGSRETVEGYRQPLKDTTKESEEDPVNLHEKYFKPESGGTWYSRFYPTQETIEAPADAPKRSMHKRYRPNPK